MLEKINPTKETHPLILIVEDHTDLRVRLHSWLGILYTQYQIYEAQSAEDALDTIKEYPVDLILMDIGLPGMNGIEATQIIKQLNPKMKIIVTTQLAGTEHEQAALKAGAAAFIPKDQLFRALVPAMDQLLSAE